MTYARWEPCLFPCPFSSEIVLLVVIGNYILCLKGLGTPTVPVNLGLETWTNPSFTGTVGVPSPFNYSIYFVLMLLISFYQLCIYAIVICNFNYINNQC